jgi:hypothetical protein
MRRYQLAQLNVARSHATMDDPLMADFVAWLDEINGLAERSPGFVWRLKGEGGTSVELQVSDDPLYVVNLTVWETIDDLFEFTYRSEHKAVFKRRFEWFQRFGRPSVCLWWLPAGTIPTVEDAERRLRHLDEHGPTAEAFTFKERFPPPDAATEGAA